MLSKIKEQTLNAHNFVLNLVVHYVHNSITDPDLKFWTRVVSRSGSAGSVAALYESINKNVTE